MYGRPSAPPHRRPLDELILTVLSQSTNDRNRDVAFARLRDRFGSWAAVRDAPVDEVEEAIRPGGISKVKSASAPVSTSSARAPASTSSTTRCSPRPRPARSSNSTSISCATAAAPATRGCRRARNAPSSACAPGGELAKRPD